MDELGTSWPTNLRNSRTLRLLGVGLLALVMLVPVVSLGGLVRERQGRAQAAAAEVADKWGAEQTVVGPALVVPFTQDHRAAGAGGRDTSHRRAGTLVFLPEMLSVDGAVDSEIRRRGIFSVPVYRADLQVSGFFAPADLSVLGPGPAAVHWDRAQLVIGLSDVGTIQQPPELHWSGHEAGFLPGTAGLPDLDAGIRAEAPFDPATGNHDFSFSLAFHGSAGLSFVPFARSTNVALSSDASSPSFNGAWLPVERRVTDDGFEARWDVSYLGRNYPQAWIDATPIAEIRASRFGLELLEPVDAYRMAERSLKYAGLFILLTFALVWLLEVLGRSPVHPIQYLMLGGALCMFFLLELSLSEHLGFAPAYLIAGAAVLTMVAGYAWVLFRSRSRAAVMAAAVWGLYGWLYVVLRNEDYALLMGSTSLFLILAAIMFATRRVEWGARTGG